MRRNRRAPSGLKKVCSTGTAQATSLRHKKARLWISWRRLIACAGAVRTRILVLTLVAGCAYAADFSTTVDRLFDSRFRFHPTDATSFGVHEYDSKFEDFSRAGVDAESASLKGFLKEFEAIDSEKLDLTTRLDRELILSYIRARLLEIDTRRTWETNPDLYSSGLSYSAFTIMSRRFAPAAARLQSLITRERQMPAALQAARVNLKNPPKIYTEIAIEQLPGTISFFEKDVPAAFTEVKDPKLLAEFQSVNRAVIAALNEYQRFLTDRLLPASHGDFRLGAELYRKKLLYDEMVDTPLDRLLEIGYRDLRRNQDAFQTTAAKVDSKRPPRQILTEVEKDYPPPSGLLQAFRDVLGGLRDFITQHNIVTIPSPVPPVLEETPPFMRALTMASMDTPGPYEKVAKEGYFNVTLPEADWTPQRIAEHMSGFSRGTIISTAIHEAYPGHYVQFLWLQQVPSKVRKLIQVSSNAEGWAHYCEQMLLDEGYGGGDPKLRLGQLQDALLRDARYIVGISMHTGKMTYEQGIDFFVKEGYQTRANAERETKRGTSDPTYLYYTLGKLEILRLRDDYKKKRGAQFSLKEFHDRFLQQGSPPLNIVRKAML